MVIWLLPPIKQYRRIFFYYFLILACSDPLAIVFLKVFGIQTIHTFSILSFLLVISIIKPKTLKRFSLVFIIFAFIVLSLNFNQFTSHSIIILHIIIFSLFIKNLVESSGKLKTINFFNVFLAFYEATLLIKFFVFSFKVETGVAYFYFTTAFELLFGIYFSLATEEKPLLSYNLIEA